MKTFTLLVLFLSSFPVLAQSEQLLVGLASLDMKPKIGIPLAGYGSTERRLVDYFDWRFRHSEASLFKPSEGVHSPIRSKVMLLKKGESHLVFISLDTIGTEDRFVKDLAKKLAPLGIKEHEIIVSATHTHGGPGTLSKRLPLQVIAVDSYKKKNYENIVSKVVQSVHAANELLRPAWLFKTKATVNGVQKNKWRRPGEDHFDKTASFLIARDAQTKEWLGGLVNFSIHGGTMPVPLMLFSSDINGAIEHELEAFFASKNGPSLYSPAFLFMNGAEGDVGADSERSVEAIERLSNLFISEAAPALEEGKLTAVDPTFSSVKKKIFIGTPKLPLRGCGLFSKAPDWLRISLYKLLPSSSYISQAKVGDVTYLSWPGEPSTQLGYDLQKLAKELGATDPIVLGLANDYMTYFTTEVEFKERAYDSCSSMYGWEGGNKILSGHEELLRSHTL